MVFEGSSIESMEKTSFPLSSTRPQLFSFLRQPDVFHGVLVSKTGFFFIALFVCLFLFLFSKAGRLVIHSSVFVKKEWYR